MTRAEQPTVETPTSGALAADSRERAVRALLRIPPLRRLWRAQFVGGVGDSLALLVLLLLSFQAAVAAGSFGGGYRGVCLAMASVLGARLLATLLFGAVLLGPVSSLIAPSGPLDRRWTMLGADGVRLVLMAVAPLWIGWTESKAFAVLLVTAFVMGVAERFWTVAKDGAAPALLPAPPADWGIPCSSGAESLGKGAVRPLPDHYDALRRLSLRTAFVSLPLAAAALVVITLISNLFGAGITWFHEHQAALGSFLAAGLFAGSATTLYLLALPGAQSPRVRSPLEGLRRPKTPQAPHGPDTGRTGAIPVLVLSCAAVAGAIAAAVGVATLQAVDLGGGPVAFGLLVLALSGGPVVGIRSAEKILPGFSRRRLLALALALTGLALLLAGLVPDPTTVLLLTLAAGIGAGVVANTGHSLLDQETEEARRARTTEHLHAVCRVTAALGAIVAPLLAAAIGPHRLESGSFVFAHGGAAFTLMLVGALLLPVGALVLGKTDDRHGVPFSRDLMDVLRGGDPAQATSSTGFFIAFEGGDGAGKSTQVQAIADWIRAKGHEVVVTREPGATAIGKRLRAILLDVGSAGLSDRAEALLYAADRAQHVDAVVRPALERGAVVITDRYIDSSVAYQGAGRDLSPTEIARISRWATNGLVPHLTVLLDVSPETARERFTEAPDRLESEPAEFHQRVRAGFLTLAAADPARYLVVDAGQEPEAVTTVVRHRLDQVLPLSVSEIEAREHARRAAEEEARRLAEAAAREAAEKAAKEAAEAAEAAEKAAEAAKRKAEEEAAARKAEAERLERERQAQLAKQRAEEEERKRREAEEAEQRAEEERRKAEEAEQRAEEERKRREAEERTRAAEQERLRKQAEEEARLRAEAEERRLEKQRRAEEALLRAERERVEAAEAATAAAESGVASAAGSPDETPTVERPALGKRDASRGGDETQTVVTPLPSSPSGGGGADDADRTQTVRRPVVGRRDPRVAMSAEAAAGAEDETAVLPPVPPAPGPAAAPAAPVVRQQPSQQRVTWGMKSDDAEETAVLPSVRPENPADRVPEWIFRPEDGASESAAAGADGERTRELPRVADGGTSAARRGRRRPGWADDAAADDEPTLADELLGRRGEEDEGRRRGR